MPVWFYYIAGLVSYVYTVLEFLLCSSYIATTLLSLNEIHIEIIRT